MNSDEMEQILNHGAEVTNEIARKKYEDVRRKIGLGR